MVSTGFSFGERESIASAYTKMYGPVGRVNESCCGGKAKAKDKAKAKVFAKRKVNEGECCCGRKTLSKLPTRHCPPKGTGSKLGARKVLPFEKRDRKSSALKYSPKVKNCSYCISDGDSTLCTNEVGESYFNRGGITGDTRIYESKISAMKDIGKVKARRNPNSKYKVRSCRMVGESFEFVNTSRPVNEGLFDGIGNMVGGLAKGASNIAGNVLNTGANLAGNVVKGGVDMAGNVLKQGADIVGGAANTAGNVVGGLVGGVAGGQGEQKQNPQQQQQAPAQQAPAQQQQKPQQQQQAPAQQATAQQAQQTPSQQTPGTAKVPGEEESQDDTLDYLQGEPPDGGIGAPTEDSAGNATSLPTAKNQPGGGAQGSKVTGGSPADDSNSVNNTLNKLTGGDQGGSQTKAQQYAASKGQPGLNDLDARKFASKYLRQQNGKPSNQDNATRIKQLEAQIKQAQEELGMLRSQPNQ